MQDAVEPWGKAFIRQNHGLYSTANVNKSTRARKIRTGPFLSGRNALHASTPAGGRAESTGHLLYRAGAVKIRIQMHGRGGRETLDSQGGHRQIVKGIDLSRVREEKERR
jgi:hypothetical protein